VEPVERYEVFLRVADGDEDHRLYMIEHWFADRPEIETVSALFKEAKGDFDALYPDVEPEDFSVEVRRLRPRDDHRPHARRDTVSPLTAPRMARLVCSSPAVSIMCWRTSSRVRPDTPSGTQIAPVAQALSSF